MKLLPRFVGLAVAVSLLGGARVNRRSGSGAPEREPASGRLLRIKRPTFLPYRGCLSDG